MNATTARSEHPNYRLIAAALISVIAVAVVAKFCLENGLAWRCASMLVLGVPCPTCGSTRALASLAEFNVFSALRFNPLLVIALFASVTIAFTRVLPWWVRRFGWPICFGAVVLNWIYLLFLLPR